MAKGLKGVADAVRGAFAQPTVPQLTKSADSPIMTETDKQDSEPTPPPTPDLNPRNRMMAEIAERAKQTRAIEAAETIPPGDEDAARQAAEDAQEHTIEQQTEPTEQAGQQAQETPSEQPDTSTLQTGAGPQGAAPIDDPEEDIVVDGKQLKVKRSQIIDAGRRTLQKETAADYKLQLASQLLNEASQRAQAQPPAQGAQPQPQHGAEAPSDADLAQIIQFGTTEQAAQAIAEIRRRSAPVVTPQQVQQFIAQSLPNAVSTQLQFQEAVRFVQSEYGDLLADPYLKPLFISEELRRRQAGETKSHKELYQAIGEDLRKHFGKPKPSVSQAAQQQPTTVAERQQAKESAPPAPKLASVRLQESGKTTKPKTREDIIAGMRAARGYDSLQ